MCTVSLGTGTPRSRARECSAAACGCEHAGPADDNVGRHEFLGADRSFDSDHQRVAYAAKLKVLSAEAVR
jgi:hypothetical protein